MKTVGNCKSLTHCVIAEPVTRISLLLLLLLQMPQAVAFSWQDLWFTADQQGQRALKNNNPKLALQKFQDHNWRAAAAYRAGDYALAAQLWSEDAANNADSAYNQGNSYFKAQQLEQAINSYQNALTLSPNHTDAIANLRLAKELQKLEKDAQAANAKQDEQQSANEKNSKDSTTKASGDSSDAKQGQKQQNQQGSQQQQELSSNTPDEQKPSSSEPGNAQTTDLSQYPPATKSPNSSSYGPKDGDPFANDYPDTEPKKEQQDGTKMPQEIVAKDAKQQGQDLKAQKTKTGSPSSDESASGENTTQTPQEKSPEDSKDQELTAQWLRQVPNDPGELMRRKFLLQREKKNND